VYVRLRYVGVTLVYVFEPIRRKPYIGFLVEIKYVVKEKKEKTGLL